MKTFLYAVLAPLFLVIAGVWMLTITSQASADGGGTIFESFFHAMGFVSFGLAAYTGRLAVKAWSEWRVDDQLAENLVHRDMVHRDMQ